MYAKLDEIEGGEEVSKMLEGEVALLSEGAAARIKELEGKLAEMCSELMEVKSRNFDLITAATAAVDTREDEAEDESEAYDVSDLIKDKE